MRIAEPLLIDFKREAQGTKRMLERINEGVFAFKPHEKSTPMGRLAVHIAELPWWLEEIVTSQEYNFAEKGFKQTQPTTQADLLAEFDAQVAKTTSLLSAATDEEMMQPWRLTFGERVVNEMPRWEAVRQLMNHIIHHRGQLSVYMRLNDIPLPGLFGPTADER